MTRIFYDCEFVEDGRTIDLISIALVAESGDEYYAIIEDGTALDRAVNNPWLRENVVPSLPITAFPSADGTRWGFLWDEGHPDFEHAKLRATVADEVRQFIQSFPMAQLWADYGAYDHVALCQLFGSMVDLPDGIPMWTADIQHERARMGSPDLVEQESGQHNALADARHVRQLLLALDALDRAMVQTLISVRPGWRSAR